VSDQHKKALIWAGVVVWLIVGGLLTIYLASALFLAFIKTNPMNAHFGTWFDYWKWYHHIPAIKKRLVLAMVFGAGLPFGGPWFAYMHLTKDRKTLFGEARFATVAEVRKAGLL
jgi:type IV secretion system protein VirD4